MVNQTEIVSRLKNFVKDRNLPHLLFVGPAGVGKTTSILALARDLYGSGYRNYILELNASDERGINVIREKVKNFARTAAISSDVSFKILIMDEADSLTSAAQHALRRTMEIYTRTCRFCLIGNYSENIIEPIQSRCSIFRFGPLSEGDMKNWVTTIANKEGVNLFEEGVEAIYEAAQGDLRKATNLLQAAAATQQGEVDDVTIYTVLGKVSPGKVREMINMGLKGQFLDAREMLRTLLIDEGLAAEDIIRIVYSEVLRLGIPEQWKVKLSDTIGEIDYRLTQGARPEIQLSALIAKLTLVGEEMGR
jgi:replication factor C small subunit